MQPEIVRHVLGPETIDSTDPAVIASATAAAFGMILARLECIVGPYAADAVFSRSHRVARRTSDWLTSANGRSRAESVDCMASELASRSAAEASEASLALIGALGDLLVSLVGEPLTYRLMGWPAGGPESDELVRKDRS
jgi:hypothetical protein